MLKIKFTADIKRLKAAMEIAYDKGKVVVDFKGTIYKIEKLGSTEYLKTKVDY